MYVVTRHGRCRLGSLHTCTLRRFMVRQSDSRMGRYKYRYTRGSESASYSATSIDPRPVDRPARGGLQLDIQQCKADLFPPTQTHRARHAPPGARTSRSAPGGPVRAMMTATVPLPTRRRLLSSGGGPRCAPLPAAVYCGQDEVSVEEVWGGEGGTGDGGEGRPRRAARCPLGGPAVGWGERSWVARRVLGGG